MPWGAQHNLLQQPFPSHPWGIPAVQRALGSFPRDLLCRDDLLEFLAQIRAQQSSSVGKLPVG